MIGFLLVDAIRALGRRLFPTDEAAGGYIDPSDPLWKDGVAKAQSTLGDMRSLHESGREVLVQFSLQTTPGEVEHVWAAVKRLLKDGVDVQLESRPLRGTAPEAMSVPWSKIEDWIVELADGRLRGAFVARAQIAMFRRDGKRVAPHMLEMEKRIVD